LSEKGTRSQQNSLLRETSQSESERAWTSLRIDFAEIAEWQTKGETSLTPGAGSLLSVVDACTEPFQATHQIGYLLHTAVDHLHALRMLMDNAGSQHTFAPFALIRAAIESASVVLWILQDDDVESTAVRALQLEYVDLCDLKRANTTADPEAGHDGERLTIFEDCLSRHGFSPKKVKPRPPGPLSIILQTSKQFGIFGTPLVWQMCSAATHGRRWARQYLTLFEAKDDGVSKVLTGRLTSDESAIAMALHTTCNLVRKARTVHNLYSRSPAHAGKSFVRREPTLDIIQAGLYVPNLLAGHDR
jgi:hypothetical protein